MKSKEPKKGISTEGATYYANAGILHLIAKNAYERTLSAPSETAGGQNDALVAIIFAAAALDLK